MQISADQPFQQMYNGTAYAITGIIARQRSGGSTITCLGGIYDGPNKTGNIIVAPTQSWLALSSGVIVNAVLASLTGNQTLANTPILSLLTPSIGACSCDMYVYGFDLS
jgi:hypothetical protein